MGETGIRRIDKGRNHWYTIDGVKADGVTTVLEKGCPKPALVFWAARTVAEKAVDGQETLRDATDRTAAIRALKAAPFEQRDAAAARGTEVHRIAEGIAAGKPVDIAPELAGHADAVSRFFAEWKPRPVLTERVVASRRWRYAGQFDLVADLPDGRRVLFDYKTSGSGIWPETAMQLAAYRYADCYLADDVEIPMSEVGIDECKAVWVRADGYDVIPLVCTQDVFNAFLHVQYVARVTDRMDAWVLPAEFVS